MASTTLLTAEQYLAKYVNAEYPPEFVRGELFYRSMPKWLHGNLQILIGSRLQTVGSASSEIHLRLSDDVIRIADIAMFAEIPGEEIPSTPPLVVVEIISPDDRHEDVFEKLREYRAWGVKNIWVVEPRLKEFHVFDSRGIIEVKAFELPGLRIDAAELFAEALK